MGLLKKVILEIQNLSGSYFHLNAFIGKLCGSEMLKVVDCGYRGECSPQGHCLQLTLVFNLTLSFHILTKLTS